MEQDCIFCKIISGEIPSYTIFENDDVKAFLDITQVTPGHTLFVPKKHLANIFAYSSADAAKYLQYLPEVARKVRNFSPEIQGLNIINNNEELAGQTVMHSHFHLIPRYQNGDFGVEWPDHSAEYDQQKYEELARQIRETKGI